MKIIENVSLADIVYYHIGGNARYVISVVSYQDLQDAVALCRKHSINDIRVIGMGTNILLPDKDFPGAVIMFEGNGTGFEMLNGRDVKAAAGEKMDALINFSLDHSLVGLEWAGGLPSSVGGAVRGNAGAFGAEIKDIVHTVDAVDITDQDLNVVTYSLQECQFSYRHSHFKENPNLVIISATFRLLEGTNDEVKKARDVYNSNILYRKTHHPMEYPSCGSVFKNIIDPEKVEKMVEIWPDMRELSEKKWHGKISMGYVINRLGFSGKQHGGAMVSPKHTNYIVNVDHAKASDVYSLITAIQGQFQQTFGFIPEPEVMLVES